MSHELAISVMIVLFIPYLGIRMYMYTDVTNMKIKDATSIYFQGGWGVFAPS